MTVTDSSVISDITPVGKKSIDVTFHNGRVYRYTGLSEETRGMFLAAESKGAFFNANIRNVYHTRRLK